MEALTKKKKKLAHNFHLYYIQSRENNHASQTQIIDFTCDAMTENPDIFMAKTLTNYFLTFCQVQTSFYYIIIQFPLSLLLAN